MKNKNFKNIKQKVIIYLKKSYNVIYKKLRKMHFLKQKPTIERIGGAIMSEQEYYLSLTEENKLTKEDVDKIMEKVEDIMFPLCCFPNQETLECCDCTICRIEKRRQLMEEVYKQQRILEERRMSCAS